jgi:hypothetical protein
MRLTLDANCLTDLANGSERAAPIQALIDLHRAGTIQVFVSAVPAPGIPAITDLPSVLPAGRYEMSYWGAAVYGSEKDDLSDRIRSIVNSTVDTLTLNRTSLKLPPDVDGLAAHIRSGHDIFVTADEHFLREPRRKPLLALGAKEILTPEKALATVTAGQDT